MCAQTDTVWSDGWVGMWGTRGRENPKGGKGQRVKVGGVCLGGTVISFRGVAVVF